MVKKRSFIIFWAVCFTINIAFALGMYFYQRLSGMYLYPVAEPFFSSGAAFFFLFSFLILLIPEIILFVAIKLLRSKKGWIKLIACICVVVFVVSAYFGFVLSVLFAALGGFWRSNTELIENFGVIDDNMQYTGVDFSEIMGVDKDNVDRYFYEYECTIGQDDFTVYFEASLTDPELEEYVQRLERGKNYELTDASEITLPSAERVSVSAKYVLKESNIVKWNEAYIAYSTEDGKLYVRLCGFAFT